MHPVGDGIRPIYGRGRSSALTQPCEERVNDLVEGRRLFGGKRVAGVVVDGELGIRAAMCSLSGTWA